MEIRTCTVHGETKFNRYKDGNYYRYRCAKYGQLAVDKRRKLLKLKAVEHLGGCCIRCGYSTSVAALHFHHHAGVWTPE